MFPGESAMPQESPGGRLESKGSEEREDKNSPACAVTVHGAPEM